MLRRSTVFMLLLPALFALFIFLRHSRANESHPRPLHNAELMALVAGKSVPESIAYEIHAHGVCSAPTDHFKTLLSNAGADPKVLNALKDARVVKCDGADLPDDSEPLERMSVAGAQIRANQFQEAAAELTDSLKSKAAKSEVGFVMGYVLVQLHREADAEIIYSEIERVDPDFPQIHTRLSMVYVNQRDLEDALTEAKLGQERNPEDPSAHLNAGIAFTLLRKFDAAKSEILAATRCKPDMAIGYQDLGLLYIDTKEFNQAEQQFKKAIALEPDNPWFHYNLGQVYDNTGDYVSSIREYREAKRLDPKNGDVRQNLGAALMHTDPGAAITEFRELATVLPDHAVCHFCLAESLYAMAQYDEAKKEYLLALKWDPTSAPAHAGLGRLQEVQKNYDAALLEYRIAEGLDPTFTQAFTDAGRALIAKKDFAGAVGELKRGEDADPTSWQDHDLRGQAFEGLDQREAAITEYRDALSIAPKELQARLDLALALEKNGDWVNALENYRQAAVDEKPLRPGFSQVFFDAQQKNKLAEQRFQQHLKDFRSAGKSADASALEAALRSANTLSSVDDNFHSAMKASQDATAQRRFEDAETSAKQAIDIAEKMQPQDGRLAEAVGQLGNVYAWRLDFKNADATYKRQLVLLQKLYGPKSPMIAPAIWNQAMLAMAQKDLTGAETLFSHSLDLNTQTYGENSNAVAEDLRALAHVYSAQLQYAKAEAEYLHVIEIYNVMYGPDDYRNAIPYASLCQVYDQWKKPDKSQDCHAHMVSLEEKQFGATSPYLARDLSSEAQALRQLGRASEAATVEARAQLVQNSSQQQQPHR